MKGHDICFKEAIWKIIPKLSILPLLIWSTDASVITLHAVSHLFSDHFTQVSDLRILVLQATVFLLLP